MSGFKFLFLVLFVFVVLIAGCIGGEIKASLGQEFPLVAGQTAVIRGEDLQIRFEDVLEDSRCPKNVTCIWEGRVRCLVQVTLNNVAEKLELTQPGLTDQSPEEIYQEYRITFMVTPYPEAGKEISREEYRLLLSVDKLK